MSTESSNKSIYGIIITIILVVIIGVLGYKVMNHAKNKSMYNASNAYPTVAGSSPTSIPPTGTIGSGSNNKPNANDQQLQQDEQGIQNSMNQLQQDQSASTQDTTTQSQDVPQE